MGAFKGEACLSQAHIRMNAKTPCGQHKEVGPLNGIGRSIDNDVSKCFITDRL